jgi:two-component system response regulator
MTNINEVEILLVEDNKNDAELAIRALTKVNLGNHLIHVKDGVEALAFLFATGTYATRASKKNPKVILLDIKMPRLDGIEVLRQIRSNPLTKAIPVVIMTSSKEEHDIIRSYELGVNSFIVKPVDFNSFSKAVSDLGMYWVLMNESPIIIPK